MDQRLFDSERGIKKKRRKKKEGLRVPSKESDKIADAGTASLLSNQMTAWMGPCRRLFSLPSLRKKIGGKSKRKREKENNKMSIEIFIEKLKGGKKLGA